MSRIITVFFEDDDTAEQFKDHNCAYVMFEEVVSKKVLYDRCEKKQKVADRID